jgi:hypothetical protein
MRNLKRITAATLAVLTSCQLVMMSGASATLAACQPHRHHDTAARYAVTLASKSSLTGVSASIEQYNPYYSEGNPTGTNATVMLTNSTYTKWAQLGWYKSKIDGNVTKRESGAEFFLSISQNYFNWWAARPVGESTWYEILYEAPSTWNFFIRGNFVWSTTSSFTPAIYEVFGETHDLDDQMPGETSNHVTFTGTNYFTGSGHTAHVVTSAITSEPQYGTLNRGSGVYDIWDTCAS